MVFKAPQRNIFFRECRKVWSDLSYRSNNETVIPFLYPLPVTACDKEKTEDINNKLRKLIAVFGPDTATMLEFLDDHHEEIMPEFTSDVTIDQVIKAIPAIHESFKQFAQTQSTSSW